MELMTEHLLLREFEINDVDAVFAYRSKADNSPYMISAPKDENGVKTYIERGIAEREKAPRTMYDFAVILKASGMLIGDCGIYPYLKDGWSEAAVEWALHKNYWGQGYGTEIATALLNFGFTGLKIHRIYATCDAGNHASARIMEKCGMRREGYYKESRPGRCGVKDRYYDELLYALLEQDWGYID